MSDHNPKNEIPHLIFDTGSLLTLLMSERGIPGHANIGLLGLVLDLAQTGQVKIVLTDMVLAEFINSPIPIRRSVFNEAGAVCCHGDDPGKPLQLERFMSYEKHGQQRIWDKARERIAFISELLACGGLEIQDTPTGSQYLALIKGIKPQEMNLAQKRFWAEEMGLEKAPARLKAHSDIAKAFDKPFSNKEAAKRYPKGFSNLDNMDYRDLCEFVFAHESTSKNQHLHLHIGDKTYRDNGRASSASAIRGAREQFVGAIKSKQLSLRSNTGEVSIADALDHFAQNKTEAFVVYQSSDDIAKILHRLKQLHADPQGLHDQRDKEIANQRWRGDQVFLHDFRRVSQTSKAPSAFNPMQGEKKEADQAVFNHAIGLLPDHGGFVTTRAFVEPFMEAARRLSGGNTDASHLPAEQTGAGSIFLLHPDEAKQVCDIEKSPLQFHDPEADNGFSAAYQFMIDIAARSLGGRRGNYRHADDRSFDRLADMADGKPGGTPFAQFVLEDLDLATHKQLISAHLKRKQLHLAEMKGVLDSAINNLSAMINATSIALGRLQGSGQETSLPGHHINHVYLDGSVDRGSLETHRARAQLIHYLGS